MSGLCRPVGAPGNQTVHAERGKAHPGPPCVARMAREHGVAFRGRHTSVVHRGPEWAPRTPPAMVAGLLEGLAAAQRGWEPSCPTDTLPEAPQLDVDAAETRWGAYMVGL